MGSLQYEVTNLLLGKIKALEPENAIKIMGYLLIQDLGEEDLMRLAYGPETLLHTLILRAKIQLGLSASSTPSSPSLLNPIARPSSNPFSQSSPRIPNHSHNPSSPSSNSWPLSGFPSNSVSPKASAFLSYDNIRGASGPRHSSDDLIDEQQLSEYLSFLNESASSSSMELGHGIPDNGDSPLHRRSYSASDACFGTEDAGAGVKPCLYFAKGFCKNGGSCKFVHGAFGESLEAAGGGIVGSPSKFEQMQHEEMLKLKAAAAHQQRLAAAAAAVSSQFMPGGGGGGPSSAYNKYMNFLLQQQNDPQR